LVHWPLIGGLLHFVQQGGAFAGCFPAQSPPRPSTASVLTSNYNIIASALYRVNCSRVVTN